MATVSQAPETGFDAISTDVLCLIASRAPFLARHGVLPLVSKVSTQTSSSSDYANWVETCCVFRHTLR